MCHVRKKGKAGAHRQSKGNTRESESERKSPVMASSLLHELNAIKPRKTRAEIEAARRAAVIAETTVPCCVFFAPWFEIGEVLQCVAPVD